MPVCVSRMGLGKKKKKKTCEIEYMIRIKQSVEGHVNDIFHKECET